MNPRVSFKTIGCRLNQAETASMEAAFLAAGYRLTPFGEPCDVCVIHGCVITATAQRDTLRALRQAGRCESRPLAILAGCPAEWAGRSSLKAPADILVPQGDKTRLPHILHEHDPSRFPLPPASEHLTPHFNTARALIKVQDGCNFRCAYCVVPETRGPNRSRPFREIIEEARRLMDEGFMELVLTGANLGSWRDGRRTLVALVEALEAIEGSQRIRLSSIEPTTVERAMADYMAVSRKLCRFLHLPLQSGDDRILAAMGRRYTVAQYRAAVEHAVETIPRLGLGCDVIAGFPGEDEAAFSATVQLLKHLPFGNIHVFPFSPRPGTRAAQLPDAVPADVLKNRVSRLLEIKEERRATFAAGFVGHSVQVLVERKDAAGRYRGWTGEYVEALLESSTPPGHGVIKALPYAATGGVLHCRLSREE